MKSARAAAAALLLGWPQGACALTDIPAQLYKLFIEGEEPPSIAGYMPATLPDSLTELLGDADFSLLSIPLQRALLWDAGLVFSRGYDSLVQVMTVCDQPMSSIFLDIDSVEQVAECDIVVCNSRSVNYAALNCSSERIADIAQCAVYRNDSLPAITDNPIWSEDGKIDIESTYQLARLELSSSSGSGSASAGNASNSGSSSSSASSTTEIYTINEMSSITSCPNKATFIVPCIVLSSDSDSVTTSSWCNPTTGELVALWLANEVAALNEAKESDKWMSIAIVFISATGILILCLIGVAIRYFKKKQKDKSASQLSLSLSPSSQPDGVQYAFLGSEVPNADDKKNKAHRSRLHSRQSRLESKSSVTSPTSSTSGDVQRANAEICRRSQSLSAFCDDKELLIKKISYRSLRFDKLIAKGANGEVWRGEYAHQEVAIKRLLLEMREDIRCVEYFAKEIHLASMLEHPNIVRFIGVSWRLLPEMCMVSEFLPQGDLAHYLASPASKQLTWKNEKISLAADIANALVYLHSLVPVIIHRDLKSLNVLLSDSYEAKLSDFGLSRERTFEETMTSGVGTLLWTAPEILRGDRYSEKADIYSYGVVLSELDTCLPPYKLNEELARGKTKSFELLPMIRNGRISPKFSDDVPHSVLTLAQLCLDQNPERRPNAMQIVYILQSKVQPTL